MKKNRLILLSMICVISAAMENHEWEFVVKDKQQNQYYMDKKIRKFNDKIVLTLLINKLSGSSVISIMIDPVARKATTLRIIMFEKQNGTGKALKTIEAKDDSFDLIPWDLYPLPKEVDFPKIAKEACRVISK